MGEKTLEYRYSFKFKNGSERQFLIRLDYDTLALLKEEKASYPGWVDLGFKQCSNCPLNAAKVKYCPIAKNLSEIIDFFKDSLSHEEVEVTVQAEGRSYFKKTALQNAVSSLIGIIMATSGCPILDRMRPMVDSHLPFPSPDEATYRILSMYLISQYFEGKHGKNPDWKMEKLVEFLDDLQRVNTSFCDRLNSMEIKDASINAIVNLNILSAFTGMKLEKGRLERLERLFKPSGGQ